MNKVHDETSNHTNIKCQEEECTFTCRYLDKLRHHLGATHSISMDTEKMRFKSFEGTYVLIMLMTASIVNFNW